MAAFQPKDKFDHVSVSLAAMDEDLELGSEPFETDDPALIAALDGVPFIKRVSVEPKEAPKDEPKGKAGDK
jgi:hypothetical protein